MTRSAAAGADIFGHMGICGADQAASPHVLALHDEIISYVESGMRELDFSDEAFGLDEIVDVGPGGTFVDTVHTARHFRRELWFPRLLDRDYYQGWQDRGAPDMARRCQERVESHLKRHTPEPLTSDVCREVDRIVAAARKNLAD